MRIFVFAFILALGVAFAAPMNEALAHDVVKYAVKLYRTHMKI